MLTRAGREVNGRVASRGFGDFVLRASSLKSAHGAKILHVCRTDRGSSRRPRTARGGKVVGAEVRAGEEVILGSDVLQQVRLQGGPGFTVEREDAQRAVDGGCVLHHVGVGEIAVGEDEERLQIVDQFGRFLVIESAEKFADEVSALAEGQVRSLEIAAGEGLLGLARETDRAVEGQQVQAVRGRGEDFGFEVLLLADHGRSLKNAGACRPGVCITCEMVAPTSRVAVRRAG